MQKYYGFTKIYTSMSINTFMASLVDSGVWVLPEAKAFPGRWEGFLIIRTNTKSLCIYFYQLLTKMVALLRQYAQKTIALILQVFSNHHNLYFLYISANAVIWGTIIKITTWHFFFFSEVLKDCQGKKKILFNFNC